MPPMLTFDSVKEKRETEGCNETVADQARGDGDIARHATERE